MTLDWLVGKQIQATQVERNGMHLELWFQLLASRDCFIMQLELPGDLDWFETDNMMLEDTHGKIVLGFEHFQTPDPRGVIHHTYRIHFTDVSYIDIFADVMEASNTYRVREALRFRVEDPNEEPWDTAESKSILDELEASAERVRQERAVREVGQIDPRILAQYNTHF